MLEKSVLVDGIKVNYKVAGALREAQGKRALLILHGWGSSSDSWAEAQAMLAEKGYQVIVPDLPGFGKTPAPATVWGIEEYAHFVLKFTQKLNLERFLLAGHSFGGQTAIMFAAVHPEKIDKLILMAAAGVRHEPGLKAKVLASSAHIVPAPFKKVLSFATRKSDYGKAQGIMKEIMKKVITQDLTAKFSKIKTPTLIIWGDKDDVTPVQDAYVMDELIPDSKLEVIPGIGHRLKSEAPERLSQIILNFLEH